MGVTGLHQQLKEIQVTSSLLNYKGQTLAVDTYGWLHKAIVSCAQELCTNQPTQKYISSITKKVEMLRYFGVEPYLVFDGASLPTKAATNLERRLKREEAQRKADELIKKGNRKLAWKEFMKAAGVTSQMAKSIMNEMDKLKVKYVVAPYEADPQMVYLEKIGLVDGILSEDSDLLIFGCNRLISKLNDFGECIEICKQDFHKVKSITGLELFTQQQLRLVAMLSGCDYTKGIPGVGIKTAFNLVKKYNNIERVLMALRADGKTPPETFADELLKADLAFQFQKVFNPSSQTLETLYAYPENFNEDMEIVELCCGFTLENEIQAKIAKGIIHPNTHELLISREQDLHNLKSKSVTSGTTNLVVKNRSLSLKQSMSERPKNTIDKFFNVKSSVKVQLSTKVSEQVSLPKDQLDIPSEINKNNEAMDLPTEKLSPLAKKAKKFIDFPDATPNMTSKTSKFFKSTPTIDSIPTPSSLTDRTDITGDSDIPEVSSPFKELRTVDTNNILDVLTDDDESQDINDSMEDIKSKRENKENSNFGNNKISQTTQKSSDFGIDEEDDEIDESPVKKTVKSHISTFGKDTGNKIDTTHFLGDQTQLRKILRDTFLYNPNTNNKFEMPSILQNDGKKSELKRSKPSKTSINARSSTSITADDTITRKTKNDNDKSSTLASTSTSTSRSTVRSATLAKFAFNN